MTAAAFLAELIKSMVSRQSRGYLDVQYIGIKMDRLSFLVNFVPDFTS